MEQPTARDILDGVHHTQDMVAQMHGEALTSADIKEAVQLGIAEAMRDRETWRAAYGAIRSNASEEAGGMVLGWLGSLFTKLMLLLFAGWIIYSVGGWSALARVFKSGAPTP